MNKKRIITFAFLAAAFAAGSLSIVAQTKPVGFTAAQFTDLKKKKGTMAVPLPTWLPADFKLEEIIAKVGAKTPIQDRVFTVVYSKKIADGKVQRFAIDAGFDGLGDLMYEPTKTLKTAVGNVILIYEPKDEDGTILKNYVMTEWIPLGKYAFHYVGVYGSEDNDPSLSMISMAETVKILKSLKKY